jgi:hypothetical protein
VCVVQKCVCVLLRLVFNIVVHLGNSVKQSVEQCTSEAMFIGSRFNVAGKQRSGVFAPVIANLCNSSFDQRTLPVDQRRAITRPLLRKPSLDASDVNNCKPISNLTFFSKTIKRLVDARLVKYADKNN